MQIRLVTLPRVRTSILYMVCSILSFSLCQSNTYLWWPDFTTEEFIYKCISFPNLGQHKQRGEGSNRTNGLSMIKISGVK
uniref:Putative secreted protein n=1 Tax=Anopheles aquasalis TaxID=42839 RepID=T1E955_ANOAQ